MEGDIVDYAVELRSRYEDAYRRLFDLMPMPGRPPNLRVAVSPLDYERISGGSKRVRGALGYAIASDNLIVLNAPKLLSFEQKTERPPCCTIVHELIHVALYNTCCCMRNAAIEECEAAWDRIHPIAADVLPPRLPLRQQPGALPLRTQVRPHPRLDSPQDGEAS